jgi:hypothetical protein
LRLLASSLLMASPMMKRALMGLLVTAMFGLAGCTASAVDEADVESELRGGPPKGEFSMLEQASRQLPAFGCRHYMALHLSKLTAALEPRLDSTDPADMTAGGCNGEEVPRNITSTYPLAYARKTACGAFVYEGIIDWTESGTVKRTLTLTDYRSSKCTGTSRPARIRADVVSKYQGASNPIATYYSVDP